MKAPMTTLVLLMVDLTPMKIPVLRTVEKRFLHGFSLMLLMDTLLGSKLLIMDLFGLAKLIIMFMNPVLPHGLLGIRLYDNYRRGDQFTSSFFLHNNKVF